MVIFQVEGWKNRRVFVRKVFSSVIVQYFFTLLSQCRCGHIGEAAEWASMGKKMTAAAAFEGRLCVCVCVFVWQLNNCSVGDQKKADGFGSEQGVLCVCVCVCLCMCVCVRERVTETEWMFVSHPHHDLDFPRLRGSLSIFFVYFCVCIVCVCPCVCQERRVRRWSWRMWSFISVSVCHASRTTAPSLSSPLTARASSCPTASTLQWVAHTDKCSTQTCTHTQTTCIPETSGTHFLFVSQYGLYKATITGQDVPYSLFPHFFLFSCVYTFQNRNCGADLSQINNLVSVWTHKLLRMTFGIWKYFIWYIFSLIYVVSCINIVFFHTVSLW